MDFSPIITAFLQTFCWLIPIMLFLGFLRSPWFKGFSGEALVKLAAWFRLPAKTYHPLHNPPPRKHRILIITSQARSGWDTGDKKVDASMKRFSMLALALGDSTC
ncbi:MAG: hypothetical protein Q3M24_10390 [Candidatus Electrothrix aestuarii]|uniref:Uncharacterized protein n=1 Tax=Candidatus Electrothrix aestuarii TaxID=3062594 RepID=A0AAU8M0Z6_9BACT|nr:hypothetical protein [Candidatus Electrothrix aestuarii]